MPLVESCYAIFAQFLSIPMLFTILILCILSLGADMERNSRHKK